MIRKVEAIVLFVPHDLAGCTAFYRDTFKLAFLKGAMPIRPLFDCTMACI